MTTIQKQKNISVQADDTTPEEIVELGRKYRSLGGAAKAKDPDALLKMGRYLLDQEKVEPEDIHALLFKSVSFADLPTIEAIKELGADITAYEEGQPLVFLAYENGNKKLALDLIQKGHFSPNVGLADGETLILAALLREDFDFCQSLVDLGADVNYPMGLPQNRLLHYAANNGSFTAIAWLIGVGADPLVRNFDEKLPSEMVPDNAQLPEEDRDQWDFDEMFNVLEAYADAFEKGEAFELPERFMDMVAKENTAITQSEALSQVAANQQKVEKVDEDDAQADDLLASIKPKTAKTGF